MSSITNTSNSDALLPSSEQNSQIKIWSQMYVTELWDLLKIFIFLNKSMKISFCITNSHVKYNLLITVDITLLIQFFFKFVVHSVEVSTDNWWQNGSQHFFLKILWNYQDDRAWSLDSYVLTPPWISMHCIITSNDGKQLLVILRSYFTCQCLRAII